MCNQIDCSNPHRKRLVLLYTLGLLFPFMQSMLGIVGFPRSDVFFYTIQPLWMAVMGGCIVGLFFLQPNESQKVSAVMWLLVAAMFWIVVRVLGDKNLFSEHNPGYIWVRAFTALFFFYPLGRLLTQQEMRRAVACIAGFWIASMVFLSILGIMASVGGFRLYMFGAPTPRIEMLDGRLYMPYHPVLTAQNLVLACNLALFLMFSFRKWWVLILCSVSIAILFVAVGLTDGTNAMLTIGLLFGMAIFVLLTERISPRTWKGLAIGGAAALLVMTISYSLNTQIIGWLGTHPTRDVALEDLWRSEQTAPDSESLAVTNQEQSNVQLEGELASPDSESLAVTNQEQSNVQLQNEPAASNSESLAVTNQEQSNMQFEDELNHREIDSTFHDRTPVWRKTLQSLLNNERNCLLIGATSLNYEDLLQVHFQPYHAHSIYLQVVLEWGIPGLVIMVAVLVLFSISAFRLLFGQGIPSWERFIPCMALAYLFSELADCLSLLVEVTVSLYLIFLFLGMTIGVDFHERYSKQAKDLTREEHR